MPVGPEAGIPTRELDPQQQADLESLESFIDERLSTRKLKNGEKLIWFKDIISELNMDSSVIKFFVPYLSRDYREVNWKKVEVEVRPDGTLCPREEPNVDSVLVFTA